MAPPTGNQQQHTGKVAVTRAFFPGGRLDTQSEEREVILTRRFPEGAAVVRVSASASYKANLGNYESASVDVVVSVPCLLEEIQDAFEYAYNFAGMRVKEGREMLDSEAASRRQAAGGA